MVGYPGGMTAYMEAASVPQVRVQEESIYVCVIQTSWQNYVLGLKERCAQEKEQWWYLTVFWGQGIWRPVVSGEPA